MKKRISLRAAVILALVALLTGCGSREETERESGSALQDETAISTEAVSPSETETSEPDRVLEETQATENVSNEEAEPQAAINTSNEEENTEMRMNVQVNGNNFTATLEENAAVDALVAMMEQGPVTIQMSDYSGFEKVGALGTSLPASNQQTTTQAGDIVLYQGDQIVMFYGSNSWSYTRLGHIDDLTGWTEALGSGDVTVTFSLEG